MCETFLKICKKTADPRQNDRYEKIQILNPAAGRINARYVFGNTLRNIVIFFVDFNKKC